MPIDLSEHLAVSVVVCRCAQTGARPRHYVHAPQQMPSFATQQGLRHSIVAEVSFVYPGLLSVYLMRKSPNRALQPQTPPRS